VERQVPVESRSRIVPKRWAGILVTLLIAGGAILILVLNLEPSRIGQNPTTAGPLQPTSAPGPKGPATLAEHQIGEDQEKDHMLIHAVWLPPIHMAGMGPDLSSDVIHLEADIHATEGNPNGFGKDEFIPYLKVRYAIRPAEGGPPIDEGPMIPMVARDGLHYGASVRMAKAGRYRLSYTIPPPTDLGRHDDPATGVAPWWQTFTVDFDWDYPGPPAGRP
jgi:periplasmic iron binding protein